MDVYLIKDKKNLKEIVNFTEDDISKAIEIVECWSPPVFNATNHKGEYWGPDKEHIMISSERILIPDPCNNSRTYDLAQDLIRYLEPKYYSTGPRALKHPISEFKTLVSMGSTE